MIYSFHDMQCTLGMRLKLDWLDHVDFITSSSSSISSFWRQFTTRLSQYSATSWMQALTAFLRQSLLCLTPLLQVWGWKSDTRFVSWQQTISSFVGRSGYVGHQKRTCTWNMEHGEEHVGTCSFYMMSMYYEHVEHTEGTCWTCQRNMSNIPKEHAEHTKGTCRTCHRDM